MRKKQKKMRLEEIKIYQFLLTINFGNFKKKKKFYFMF